MKASPQSDPGQGVRKLHGSPLQTQGRGERQCFDPLLDRSNDAYSDPSLRTLVAKADGQDDFADPWRCSSTTPRRAPTSPGYLAASHTTALHVQHQAFLGQRNATAGAQ